MLKARWFWGLVIAFVAVSVPVAHAELGSSTGAVANAAGVIMDASIAGSVDAGLNAESSGLLAYSRDSDISQPILDRSERNARPMFGRATLPQDLSPWGMFSAADWIVKAVMLGLLFASLVTWTIWLAKSLELRAAMQALIAPLASMSDASTFSQALPILRHAGGSVAALAEAAVDEIEHSKGLPVTGTKERIAMRLQRIEAHASRNLNRGTGVLATIGSTAPFVGLFGTVWGIMNAFIGISKAQTTNLSVVAPGIAEALLATALGLVAAIPAVMIYNVFARRLVEYRGQLGDLASEIQRVSARDLDRASTPK